MIYYYLLDMQYNGFELAYIVCSCKHVGIKVSWEESFLQFPSLYVQQNKSFA